MPQRYSGYLTGGYMLGWLAPSGERPRSSISRAAAKPTTSTISRSSSSKVACGMARGWRVPVLASETLTERKAGNVRTGHFGAAIEHDVAEVSRAHVARL